MLIFNTLQTQANRVFYLTTISFEIFVVRFTNRFTRKRSLEKKSSVEVMVGILAFPCASIDFMAYSLGSSHKNKVV